MLNVEWAFHFLSFIELKSAQEERDAIKEKANNLRKEYERLCNELADAQVCFYRCDKMSVFINSSYVLDFMSTCV